MSTESILSPDPGPPPVPSRFLLSQPFSPPAPAAGQPEKRCPKCGLLWFYARDIGGDLACIYCGRAEYKRPVADTSDPGPGSRR
jgi:hypothetical protein